MAADRLGWWQTRTKYEILKNKKSEHVLFEAEYIQVNLKLPEETVVTLIIS